MSFPNNDPPRTLSQISLVASSISGSNPPIMFAPTAAARVANDMSGGAVSVINTKFSAVNAARSCVLPVMTKAYHNFLSLKYNIRMIAISLSPNTESDDVWVAIKTFCSPWTWKDGKSIGLVENWFRDKFKTDTVYSFNSGRTALYAILKSFTIGTGDEVIVQAFTCVAVPEVVMWAGAKPIYSDIDNSYNIDSSKLEKLITKKTKAVIVQHTFGVPARIKEIGKIAKKYNLVLIEDCAHSLGATVDGKLVGSFGDAAFFSFGRDKVISSVFGGVAVINKIQRSKDLKILKKLKNFYNSLSTPSSFWILQQLLHPILFHLLILPFYNFFELGKVFLVLFQRLKLLSFPIQQCEYAGKMPDGFLTRYPNGLAILAFNQLRKLDRFNRKRVSIARKYGKTIPGAIYVRYPMQLRSRNIIVKIAKKKGIFLGNWYHCVIDPFRCPLAAVGYRYGSCTNAERLAEGIVNLPTHPGMRERDVERVIMLVSSP